MKRVTVVTINFNQDKITEELLDSIAETNTYENLEVIVVDNGSTDCTSDDDSQERKADIDDDRGREGSLALFAIVQHTEVCELDVLRGRIVAAERFCHRITQSLSVPKPTGKRSFRGYRSYQKDIRLGGPVMGLGGGRSQHNKGL